MQKNEIDNHVTATCQREKRPGTAQVCDAHLSLESQGGIAQSGLLLSRFRPWHQPERWNLSCR